MEAEIAGVPAPDAEFVTLLRRSRAGDPQALLHVVELLEPDIEELSRGMRMERGDALQTLRTELIGLVLRKRA